LGAATKQYVDQFLPLSGGTITGSLNVNNTLEGAYLYAANGFYANAFNGWEWVFDVDNSTGSKIQQYRSGWYDIWSGTDGSRDWVGGGVSLMALDGSGNLSVRGSVSSGGNLSLAGTAYVTGNVVASANVTANAAYATNGLYTISDGSHGMFVSGSGPDRYVRFNTNFQFHFVNSTGNLLWENPYGVMLVTDYASSFFYNNQGHLGGYGAYQNLSDDRFKMSVVPASYGLAEILRLAPIRFARISRRSGDSHEPRSEIGFSAQQVREVIPEAVMAVGVELADGTGGLDSDDPTLAIGYDAITAALVNAVKQLSDAVKDIDGRLSAAMRA
jgi:hypothetical protein